MTVDGGTTGWLAGQVAVVTGSGEGIGAGIARTLGGFGATVVITDIVEEKALEQAAALGADGITALGVQHDVTSGESGFALAAKVVDEFGHVDVLVNNAGISGRVPIVEMSERQWDSMLSVNLTGVQRTTRAFAPHLKDQGHGSIISISSVAGRSGKANMSHYCATKFGVIGFSQSLALELAPYNVRVNTVCPGIVRTNMWDVELAEISEARGISVEEAWDQTLADVPLNRPQTPEDIGRAVAFLASSLADNITGQALNVDGGYELS